MPANNKDYQQAYMKQHYLNNKDYYKTKAKIQTKIMRELAREFTNSYKISKGCIDCGYNQNPLALQFDHVRGKKYAVSQMVSSGLSIKAIQQEIEKCEVRCANCHAIITYERRYSPAKAIALSG